MHLGEHVVIDTDVESTVDADASGVMVRAFRAICLPPLEACQCQGFGAPAPLVHPSFAANSL
jgi:hypothetical protein